MSTPEIKKSPCADVFSPRSLPTQSMLQLYQTSAFQFSPCTLHVSAGPSCEEEDELVDPPLLKTCDKEALFNIKQISEIAYPVVITDREGRIRVINSAALVLLGITCESVENHCIHELMPTDLRIVCKEFYQIFLSTSADSLDAPVSIKISKISGKVNTLFISLNLFRYIHQEVLIFSVFTKINQTKEHKKITSVAQRFIEGMRKGWENYKIISKSLKGIEAEINKLLADYTHEIGNYGFQIGNFIDLALQNSEPKLDKTADSKESFSELAKLKKESLGMAKDSCLELEQLTKQGMLLFKKQPICRSYCLFNQKASKLVSRLRVLVESLNSDKSSCTDKFRDSGIKFNYKSNILKETAVFMDFSKFFQVIQNLVFNAKSFTPRGGSITLTLDIIKVKTKEDDSNQEQHLFFSVVDTGCGITKDKLPEIFTPFSPKSDHSKKLHREHGGNGLGLSICQNLIQQLNGTIQVESPARQLEDGSCEGTNFFGTIPIKCSQKKTQALLAEETLKANPSTSVRLMPLNILVAEDNTVNQKLFPQLINPKENQNTTHNVKITEDGGLAFEAYKEAANLGRPFDIIFMDFLMGEMDGITAAQNIISYWKAHFEALHKKPIIILTTALKIEKSDECITDFLPKPYNKATLQAMLKKHAPSS